MEFMEEESRPRFLFHSRAPSAAASKPEISAISKLHVAVCSAAAALLLFSAFYYSSLSQTLAFLLAWIALSLLFGPFAPSSITGGDVRVGVGEPLEPLPEPDPMPEQAEESRKRISWRRSRARRSDDVPSNPAVPVVGSGVSVEKAEQKKGGPILVSNGSEKGGGEVEEEKEWNEEDFEILKKQILKHPVGTARRWELIAEAFRGRHGVESVIRTAKSLSEKRPGADDSFAQFLRQRKPLDKRAEAVHGELSDTVLFENGDSRRGDAIASVIWSSGEDIALLNALKAFPKDVSMRWEKIAAAVPGKLKAACMKRVTELKRDFRSSKASEA